MRPHPTDTRTDTDSPHSGAKVVVIHRYFWPDAPPYASMLRAISERWIAGGAQVEAITAQPSYRGGQERRPRRERLGGLAIRRVPAVPEGRVPASKLLNLVAFPTSVGVQLLRAGRPDVVMCSTAPQVTLGAVVSKIASMRGSRFIYHCMDLHPEIGKLSGEFANPMIYRLLMKLDAATMRRASVIVVLSDDMRRAVLERDPSLAGKVRVLNNFDLPEFGAVAQSPMEAPATGTARVVFTGNIGRFQGLDKVMRGLARAATPNEPIEFVLMGDGAAKPELETLAGEVGSRGLSVKFLPQGPAASAKALMRSAHLGVVSLQPDVIRFAYPSKTATYAANGLPMLVVCEQDSELARTVRDSKLGWSAWSEDEIADRVREAVPVVLDAGMMDNLRQRVLIYATEEFAEVAALDRWDHLLDEIRNNKEDHA